MLSYQGYHGVVEYVDEDALFLGRVVGIRDTIVFQGQSVDELRQSFRDSVDDYLEFCEKLGRTPEKPTSGNFTVRVSPELHRDIQILAGAAHKSLNAWITGVLEEARDRYKQRHAL